MSDKTKEAASKDPTAVWREMLGDWEKNFNAFANKAMEKEDFAKAMHTATSAASGANVAFGDLMQRYLSTMNLPSRAELTGIGERLQAMESQMNYMTTLLQAIAGDKAPAKSAAPKPARTRKPAAAGDAS